MEEFSGLPELVRQFRLETVINQTQTIHTSLRSHRKLPSRVTWIRATERPLGHGGFGEVWLEKRVDEGQHNKPVLRAVKSIYINANSHRRDYIRELEALAKFSSNSHKYAHFFVQFYGWYESIGQLHAALEYCEYGDLNNYIKSVGTITEKEVKDITWQVLGGLTLMHEEGFAHRDVKPANILIKKHPPEADWWVKLGDLGLSKRAEDNASATVERGTPGFLAPEKLGLNAEGQEEVDPFPTDMWCLGETISHMLTGHGTFQSPSALYHYASGNIELPIAALRKCHVSDICIDFLRNLMSPRPGDRLHAKQALSHLWVAYDEQTETEPNDERNSLGPQAVPIAFSVDQGTQRTQPSAAWTEETMVHLDSASKPIQENCRRPEDHCEKSIIRLRHGHTALAADVGATDKRNIGRLPPGSLGGIFKPEDKVNCTRLPPTFARAPKWEPHPIPSVTVKDSRLERESLLPRQQVPASSVFNHENVQYPRKPGKTRIPARLVSKRALIDFDYTFTEERNTVVLLGALCQEQIDELLQLSDLYKKSELEDLAVRSEADTILERRSLENIHNTDSKPKIDSRSDKITVIKVEVDPERPRTSDEDATQAYVSGSNGSGYYWANRLDNATAYSPSVSTVTVNDSEDEGTQPYAWKRIQRDFPDEWELHPLGRKGRKRDTRYRQYYDKREREYRELRRIQDAEHNTRREQTKRREKMETQDSGSRGPSRDSSQETTREHQYVESVDATRDRRKLRQAYVESDDGGDDNS